MEEFELEVARVLELTQMESVRELHWHTIPPDGYIEASLCQRLRGLGKLNASSIAASKNYELEVSVGDLGRIFDALSPPPAPKLRIDLDTIP